MPMKNPPHPGLSIRLNLPGALRSVCDRGREGARRKPRHTFAFDQRPSRGIAGHGDPARKGLWRDSECRRPTTSRKPINTSRRSR